MMGDHSAWPWALLVLWPLAPFLAVLAWRYTSRDARILRARRRDARRAQRRAAREADARAHAARRGVAP